jgi:hypothetical protein
MKRVLASRRLLLSGLLPALFLAMAVDRLACAADGRPASPALDNGIRLPDRWPPQPPDFSDAPQRPPYLASPPEVIPIDVGRQLFVDDFLIAGTTLERTFHQPAYYAGNPVLKPDRPWESGNGRPYAMPFSDGVWFDCQDRLFKLWYFSGAATCYATSRDGIHWEKPQLDVVPGTNIVLNTPRDSATVWIDARPARPQDRFKMALYQGTFQLYRSADGIHWTRASKGAKTGDRSTFFYDPFVDRWVFSIRTQCRLGRGRLYWDTPDFFSFSEDALARRPASKWTSADSADWPRDDLKARPQLYNLDCAAYESLLLGLFSVWRGDYRAKPVTEKAAELQTAGRPKQNSVCVGFSRDGFHWDRPDRRAFLPVSERMGDWNWGNVQSTAPCCLVVGEELWFYVSGRAGRSYPGAKSCDSGATTGLARLRRDGFASLEAGEEPGTLTTRTITFQGKYPFVNVDAKAGQLRMEVLDAGGKVIAPFAMANCLPVRADSTRQPVQWQGAADLSSLSGKQVRFRFELRRGRLYSFWVSPALSGASYGYLAAGGPGFTGPTDTVGRPEGQRN